MYRQHLHRSLHCKIIYLIVFGRLTVSNLAAISVSLIYLVDKRSLRDSISLIVWPLAGLVATSRHRPGHGRYADGLHQGAARAHGHRAAPAAVGVQVAHAVSRWAAPRRWIADEQRYEQRGRLHRHHGGRRQYDSERCQRVRGGYRVECYHSVD